MPGLGRQAGKALQRRAHFAGDGSRTSGADTAGRHILLDKSAFFLYLLRITIGFTDNCRKAV